MVKTPILQFASRAIRMGCALFAIGISSAATAQTSTISLPQVAIWPQHDLFTFEIGRALHAELSKRANARFELIDQRRVEQFVNIPCFCDGQSPNDPSTLHGEAWLLNDRKQGALMVGASVYFALVADSADEHWYVDLRMRDTRKHTDERSLGRMQFTSTPQIVTRMAELIASDQEFGFITTAAKSGVNSPPYLAIIPQRDLYTIEIARVLNERFTRTKSTKFFVVPQVQVEELLRRVAPDENPLDTVLPLHSKTVRSRDQRELAYAVRSTSYVMLETDSLDNHQMIDVRMFANSYTQDSRSLGKVRYTNAKETGTRAAQLIAADTAFKRMVANGVRKY